MTDARTARHWTSPGCAEDLVRAGRVLRRLDVVESTGSTNADLLARHAAGADIDGAVPVAEHQSAGRGRLGRNWASPRSGIALSVGVDAAGLIPSAWGWLPLLTGVAVTDAVRAITGIEGGTEMAGTTLGVRRQARRDPGRGRRTGPGGRDRSGLNNADR